MSGELINDGEPIFVATPRDRIGHGPWARLLVTEIVGSEGSSVAERGRAMARGGNVHNVRVEPGRISAAVTNEDRTECAVTFDAAPVPPRIWDAVLRASRLNSRLVAATEGSEQSVQLEHLMRFDWNEPLVPKLEPVCACPDERCAHVAALAYVVADLIDGDPSLLLAWRGCGVARAEVAVAEGESVTLEPSVRFGSGSWEAAALPAPRRLRSLPAGAVLRCLGPSDLPIAGGDLVDALQRAYAVFSK